MLHNYRFTNASEALPVLLKDLSAADEVGSRAGRTRELTHVGITLDRPLERELLVPGRKPNLAAQIVESVWVLSGRNDVETLAHYLPRAEEFSDDGETWRAGYGKRLRAWPGDPRSHFSPPIDQLAWVVEHLRKSPGSRQAVMSIWNPAIDTQPGKDIPCNDWLNFSSRLGYLDLHVALRSNDVIWGWSGINQFEWSVMLEVVAGLLGLTPGKLHFSTTSFHIYERHWKMADEITRSQITLPSETLRSRRFDASALPTCDVAGLDQLLDYWWRLEYDIRTGSPMVQGYINAFPEPMLRSWLRVLRWYWTGDRSYLNPIKGTRLELATQFSIERKKPEPLRVGSSCPKCGIVMTTSGGRTPLKCIKASCNYYAPDDFSRADGTFSAEWVKTSNAPVATEHGYVDFLRKHRAVPCTPIVVTPGEDPSESKASGKTWWPGDYKPGSGGAPTPEELVAADPFEVRVKKQGTRTGSFSNPHQLSLKDVHVVDTTPTGSPFIQHVIALHNEKHAAYGDSWKKRGEMLGIMANIARKIDRLGGGETTDETSADTAIDLFVYLAKYRVWLEDPAALLPETLGSSDTPNAANAFVRKIEQRVYHDNEQPVDSRNREEEWLTKSFDRLEEKVREGKPRTGLVEDMTAVAYELARLRWEAEQDEYKGADHD